MPSYSEVAIFFCAACWTVILLDFVTDTSGRIIERTIITGIASLLWPLSLLIWVVAAVWDFRRDQRA